MKLPYESATRHRYLEIGVRDLISVLVWLAIALCGGAAGRVIFRVCMYRVKTVKGFCDFASIDHGCGGVDNDEKLNLGEISKDSLVL